MYTKFLVFFLVYMILEYILLISEWFPYLNMISNIQGYKFNWYKNLNNNFNLKNILIYFLAYIILLYVIYYYIIKNKKSYFEGFLFTSFIYGMWDICLFSCFDKAVKYLPLLCYDTFVVGGIKMVITQYLLYNYYDILKKYIWLLFIFYILTMLLFFYVCYRYNPDLSNIKGIVLF
jgi:hypothetical protein